MPAVSTRAPRPVALRPLRHARLWLGAWLAMVGVVVVASLIPPQAVPLSGFDHADKLHHLASYFALSAMATALFATIRARAGAGMALMLLGIALELAQAQWTTQRQAEAWDALANTVGVLLGLAATPAARVLAWVDARLG